MNGNTVGGGEILDHIGKQGNNSSPYLDNTLVRLFDSLPYVKFVIYILILLIMAVVILKLFRIKSPFKGRGIVSELNYIEQVKKRDASILRANKLMNWATNLVENSPFCLAKSQVEYWQYNITRANIRIPGKTRVMKAVEFNAIVQLITFCACCVGLIIVVLANVMLGWTLIIFTIVCSNFIPMAFLRQTVKAKDMEIQENFADYYLMLHYVLIANANTPLEGIMRSFAKTTNSKEMKHYIDVCIHYIDTYGEYESTRHIAKDYRELPEVGKLMRLIRQANEGGNIEAELIGFRTELLNAKRYAISKRMDRLVMKARASFNILMPVLVQAVISAMSIYWSDLGLASTLLGG